MSLTVTSPAANAVERIAVNSSEQIVFDFPEDTATYARDGANLTITLENGAQIVLENFFVVPEGATKLPELQMEDGTVIASADFLKTIDPDFNVDPAAGPQSQSSGLNAYNDGAGNLIGGIDRLGDQGTFQWGGSNGIARHDDGVQMPATGGTDDGGSTGPVRPQINYQARAVLYKTDADASDAVNFRLVSNGQTVDPNDPSVQWSVDSSSEGFFVLPPTVNADGTLSVTLTPAGLAALQGGGNIYDYLKITVNGESYTMQVVVNQSGDFSSVDEDAKTSAPGSNPHGGNESGHEWHTESDGSGKGDREASHGDNEAWFTKKSDESEAVFQGKYTSHEGDDTITITGKSAHPDNETGTPNWGSQFPGQPGSSDWGTGPHGMAGGASIDTGSGYDKVDISVNGFDADGMHAEGGTSNSIINAEEININSKLNYGVYAGENSSNSITNANNVTIFGGTNGMVAEGSGASNTIQHIAGNVTITGGEFDQGTYTVLADNGGKNLIDDVRGDVVLDITRSGYGGYNLYARDGGVNVIQNVQGSLIASSAQSGVGIIAIGGHNRIENIDKNITINNDSGVYASNGGSNTISNVGGDFTVAGSGISQDDAGIKAIGGTNLIEKIGKNVSIKSGDGMYASGTGGVAGTNTLRGIANDVSMQATDTGMEANSVGSGNTLENIGGNVLIKAGSDGLSARSGSFNTIHNVGGAVTVQGNNALSASSNGKNTIDDVASVTIEAKLNGAYATDGGINSISAQGDVSVTSAGTGMLATSGNAATGIGGLNTVAGQNVSITSTQSGGKAMWAQAGGQNTVTAEQNATITGTVYANGRGINEIYGSGADNKVTINGSMDANSSGHNLVSTKDGNDLVTINAGAGYGMTAGGASTSASENKIDAGAGNDTITITSSNANATINALGGKNIIDGGAGYDTLTVSSTGTGYYTASLMAQGGADVENVIRNVEHVSIANSGPSGYGMRALTGGKNTITGATDAVAITGHTGMSAEYSGSNTITGSGDVSIIVGSNAMEARQGGHNSILDSTGNVTLQGAMNARDKGSVNTIDDVGGKFSTIHMNAQDYGSNVITDVRGEVVISGQVVALSSGINRIDMGSYNTNLSFDTILVGSTTKGNTAAQNIISTHGDITVNTQSESGVRAIAVNGGSLRGTEGINTLSGRDISVSAEKSALYAMSGGRNILNAERDVYVSGKQYSLMTDGDGTNEIYGSDGANTFTIIGTVYSKFSGNNVISTKGGNDLITIDGRNAQALYAGGNTATSGNTIDAGAGNDVITITSSSTTAAIEVSVGKNIIDGGAGHDTLTVTHTGTGGYALKAQGGTGVANEIHNVEKVAITGYNGLYGSGGGTNLISEATESVSITARRYALEADTNGKNIIENAGNVSLIGTELNSVSMVASGNGSNLLQNVGDVTMQADRAGMRAMGGGKNSIDGANDVNIHVNSTADYGTVAGMYATDGGSNAIKAKGDIDISITGVADYFYGIYAVNDPYNSANPVTTNSISTSTGDITIKTDNQSASGFSYGIYAGKGGANTVTAQNGTLDITSDIGIASIYSGVNNITAKNISLTTNNFGIRTTDYGIANINFTDRLDIKSGIDGISGLGYGGQINIDGGGHGDISITTDRTSKQGMSNGIYSAGTATVIKGIDTLDVSVSSMNTGGYGYGISASGAFGNTITANDWIHIKVDATQRASGIFVNSGKNDIQAGGELLLTVNGVKEAHGMVNQMGGQNIIHGTEKVIIEVTAGDKGYGMSNLPTSGVSGGGNSILGAKTVNINVHAGSASAGSMYGMYSQMPGSSNVIDSSNRTDDVTVSIQTPFSTQTEIANNYSMFVSNGSNIITTGSGNDHVDLQGNIKVEVSGSNKISTGSGSDTINIKGNITAEASPKGTSLNSILAGSGDDIVTIQGALRAIAGSGSTTSSSNVLDGGEGKDSLTINVTDASTAALYAMAGFDSKTGAGSASNVIRGFEDVSITSGNNAQAMVAGQYGSNTIDGATGSLTITGGTGGLVANGGTNSVTNSGSVTITTNTGHAMWSNASGVNSIDNSTSDQALTLIIQVKPGSGHALYASGANSLNQILGSSKADDITIAGGIHSEYGGRNVINTGGGNDVVRINGNITGDGNKIDTGSGDDKVIITAGDKPVAGLELKMGGGDHDLLVLTAKDASAFQAAFGDWLQGLLNAGGHGIECLGVTDQDTWNWLQSQSWFTSSGIDLQYGHLDEHGNFVQDADPSSLAPATFDLADDSGHHDVQQHTPQDAQHDDAGRMLVDGADAQHTNYHSGINYDLRADSHELDGANITLSDGRDHVSVTDGLNKAGLDLGAGDDILSVHSGMNGTTVETGTGNDTVHLYGGVTDSTIRLGEGSDSVFLHQGGLMGSTTLEGGHGLDTLHLGDMGQGTISLGDIASRASSFEHIDLTGGGDQTLEIDTSGLMEKLGVDTKLDGDKISDITGNGTLTQAQLEGADVLLVTGDTGDKVHVTDGADHWQNTGNTVTYDGVQYDAYSSGEHGTEIMLIQHGVDLSM